MDTLVRPGQKAGKPFIAYGGYPRFVRTARRTRWSPAECALADEIALDLDFSCGLTLLAELKDYLRAKGASVEKLAAAERLAKRYYAWSFHGAGSERAVLRAMMRKRCRLDAASR